MSVWHVTVVVLGLVLYGFYTYEPSKSIGSVSEFEFDLEDGGSLKMGELNGKVVLVVNTASKCGFTPQLGGLEELYQEFKGRGLEILGVPSHDFQQEPLEGDEISSFCSANYGVSFPLTKKTSVASHPFFEFVGSSSIGLGPLAKPRWNFWKILIDKNGHAVNYFTCFTSPSDQRLRKAIENAL